MDIWISRVKRKAKCHYCDEYITLDDEFEVKGKSWRKPGGSTYTFTKMFYWHIQCWLESGKKAATKGSEYMLNEEQRKQRLYYIAKHARVKQRLKQATEEGKEHLVAKFEQQLVDMQKPMERLGGVPKKWKSGD